MHRDAGKPCVTQADNMETPAYGPCVLPKEAIWQGNTVESSCFREWATVLTETWKHAGHPCWRRSQTEPVPALQVAASDVAMLQSDTRGIQVCKCAALTAAGMSQQGPSLMTASLQPSGDPFFWNRAWPQSCLYKGWLHWMRIAFPSSHSRSSSASCSSSVVQTLDVTIRATFQTQMR